MPVNPAHLSDLCWLTQPIVKDICNANVTARRTVWLASMPSKTNSDAYNDSNDLQIRGKVHLIGKFILGCENMNIHLIGSVGLDLRSIWLHNPFRGLGQHSPSKGSFIIKFMSKINLWCEVN